jgi:valyl-tRNA synthetase
VVGKLQAARRRGYQSELLLFLFYHLSKLLPQRTRAGELVITPKQYEAEWYRWMESIQDWCVSRQLWWGHRCPAYFVRIEDTNQDVRMFLNISLAAILTGQNR